MSNHSSGEPAVKYPVDNKVVVIAAILTALGLITLIMVIVLCRCLKWCRKTSKKEQVSYPIINLQKYRLRNRF